MITRSFRQKLLISASLSAMLMTGVAEARSGRVFSGRGGADPAAAAARAAQEQATRTTETNSASKRAIETFRRAAETRRAAMDAQIQARALARAAQNLVPNGLKPGGLQVAAEIDPSLWVGANGPVESAGEGGRTSVTVEQTEQKAILNWDSFNVGRETDLKFNQGGSDWVVLNRVHDATASQIHGTINAPGTVLILNQNGILFGGTSQVNVRNLVASAATITDTQFHEYGLYSSGTTGAGNNTLHISSFTEALGSIMVEAGAQISTIKPASVVEGGGYVLLMGTDVTNEGTITTPRGQALMAAGKDFAVRAGQGTDVNQWATTRGNELIVNVEGGTVVNRGVIEAAEGDITLVGKHVEQDGVAVATTTVNTRGTIHLLTDLSDSEATITLAGDSLTLVVPDYDSDTTATDAQRDAAVGDIMVSVASFPGWNNSNLGNLLYTLPDRKDLSRIDIRTGGTVDFQSESQTIATGGQVAIVGLKRVFVADGAQIDVSGSSGVALSMESNSLLVNVQPYEMRDSPLNREGEHLKSTDIWIDVRSLVLMPDGTGGYDGDRYYTGNGFLEVGGHLGNVERGIGEWTAQGGTITINSAEIVAQKGAIFDISGGSIDYQAGLIRSTRVMGADGKLYDISNVPANIEVVAYGDAFVRKHERWGEAYTQVWSNPLFSGRSTMRWQDGYSVGRDAGVLTLRAPTVVFEGEIIADVITGERQIAERPGYPDPVDFPQLPQRIDGYKLPQDVAPLAGQLFVGRGGFTGILTNNEVIQVPLESTVVIGAGTDVAGSIDATTALSEDLLNRVEFSAADLNRFGLGELRVLTTGSITIDEALSVKNGGQMRLRAQDFDVRADLTARSGVIAMFGTQDGDESMTSVRIGGGVMLDTSGLWVNLPKGGNAADLAHLDGGDIYIASNQGDITLGAGSLLDASAGGAILLDNRIKGADGGDVTLTVNDVPAGTHNRVVLDGMIQSYGSEDGVGGTLTLTTSDGVELGDTMLTEHGMLGADERAPFMLHLSEDTVLPAGMVLPSDITIVKRRIAPGEIVAVNTSVGIYHNATGGLVFTEEWTVPTGLTVTNFDGVSYRAGAVVPVGTDVRTITGTLPAGSPLPELLYPFGMTIAAPVSVHYAAGTILTEDLTVPAGTRIDRGNGLGVAANVHETLVLEQDFFQQGFSQYTIRSFADIVMAEDATIDVAAPVRRVTPDSAGVASGANLGDAMELWLPEMFREDAANGRFIQRAGAGISLTASNQRPGTNLPPPAGSLFIGKDAALRVDDGQSIALHAYDSMLVEGRLDAHGGNIALEALGAPPISTSTTTYDASKALWLGDGAVLDVSGRAHEAVDRFGRRYADVSAGGAVSLSGGGGSFVITEAGALIDISGASAEIDYATRGIPGGTGTTLLASNGGSLALSSRRGIVLDAQLRAHAGGEGAIGGLLSIDQQSLGLAFGANMPAFLMPDHIRVLGKVVLDAAHIGSDLDDIAFGDCIAGCWTPGQTLEEAAAANAGKPDLLLQARIGADKIEDSGFGSLTMSTDDVILLNGAVDLTLAGTLTLQGIVAAADGDLTGALPAEDDTSGATNTDNDSILRAGYVYINGNGGNLRSTRLHPTLAREPGGKNSLDGPPTIGAGTLTIEGNLLDVGHGRFGVNGAIVRNAPDPLMPFEYAEWNTVHLSSSGDFRLIGGDIKTGGNLTLTAAQIYPVTNATAGLFAGVLGYQRPGQTASYSTILPGSVLTINGIEGATPAAPLSLYGRLTLSADIIEQGGIIRAPMGKIVLGSGGSTQWNSALPVLKEDGTYDYTGPHVATSEVNLLPGSVTSVSAAGLVLPYGGTVDGTSWVRKDVNDLPAEDGAVDTTLAHQGIAIVGSLRADEGSVLDLSGGGTVAGAGFIPGRGGSIDVLSNPLYDISPAYRGLSSPDNKVYALVPSYGASTAPVPEAGRNQPGAGQQIIVPEGVAGLPAGAYTLLPGEYALLPGAFRVELGAAVSPGAAVSRLADGSFFAAVGSANALTGERSGQPLAAILTPADVVRTFAQYNEMDLATYFAQAPRASLFDNPLPSLPQDGKQLLLAVTPQKDGSDRPLLSFNGTGLFGAGENGRGGSVAVVKGVGSTAFDGGLEIVADGALATEGFIAINASDLNAIGASLMTIGGEMDPAFVLPGYQPILNIRAGGGTLPQVQTTGAAGSYTIDSTGFTTVAVRDGAVLEAPQVMLIAGTNNHVVVDAGARISSIGMGAPAYDASSGYFGQTGANVLAVSNGMLDITTSAVTTSAGSITVADGASLHSEGALAFVSNGAVKLSGEADYGGRYINLSTGNFNIGGSEALTDAETQGILPSGITLNQSVIERLMAGSTASGVPAAERLILTASQQINFYGSVDMDAGSGADGKSLQLVLNAPALYGHGGDGDAVSISAGTLVWNGIVTQSGSSASASYGSIQPGAPIAGGPGYGTGTLNLVADTLVLGYQDGVAVYHNETLDRLALGFSAVNLIASEQIISGEKGSLSVWQSQAVHGEAGTGGTLNLVAPVVTGKAGSVFSYRTGGELTLRAPEGAAPVANMEAALGAEIRLNAASIAADTAIALPSGRLVMTATEGDITLGDGAVLDMAGRATEFFDQTRYSWGGDVVLESAHGDVSLAEGAAIELGAQHNHAGMLKVTAVEGAVTLAGVINGHATGAEDEPDPELRNSSIDIRAGSIADFTNLNTRLTDSGVTDTRSFIIKTGDLVIGDEMVARNVTVSADGGSLTVNGRIDASGAKPGTIRLSARDDLTLASSAVLDASADTLWVDSYGAPVEASNRGFVELTSAGGTLALQQGATIDLSSADDVARGQVELNAQRVGADDVAIAAAQTLTITGADSISVNAFRTYEPENGIINQALMDGIHAESEAFINAAIGNGALLGRMAGLTAYADAFHLRPGVELVSAPDESLSVSGDLNLADYRYASLNADTQRTGEYGSGEPGVLLVRASDDLNIFGSITDGFAEPARTPDDNGWVIYAGLQNVTTNTFPADYHVPSAMRIGAGTALPLGAVVGYDVEVNGFNVAANRRIGAESRLSAALTLNREWVLTADVRLPDGTTHARGTIFPVGTLLPVGTVLGKGTVLPQQVSLQAMLWPAGAELPAVLTLSAPAQLQAGDIIPRNTGLQFDRLTGLLAESVTLTEPMVLAGNSSTATSSLPNVGSVDFAFNVNWGTRVERGVEIGFGFIVGNTLSVPSYLQPTGWQTTAPIWNSKASFDAGDPPRYNVGDYITTSFGQGTYIGAGVVLPQVNATSAGDLIVEAQTIEANANLSVFTAPVAIRANVALPAGTVLPAGTNVQQAGAPTTRPTLADGTQGRIWAVAPMLAPGSESWSMRLVGGADIASADGRALRAQTDLAEKGLTGDLVLSDRHYVNPDAEGDGLSPSWAGAINRMQNFSVIRTGTGTLDLLAGGSYQQDSLYGIYTAGTQTADIGGTTPDGYNVFNQPRATVAGADAANPYIGHGALFAGYLDAIEDYRAWYPEHGGDLLLNVQGDIRSYTTTRYGAYTRVGSASVGNWLWRQGAYGQAEAMGGADMPTAWWINFGGYVPNNPYNNSATAPNNHNGPLLEGFMGIGTLGGGNLTVAAGGNAGVIENWAIQANGVSEVGIGNVASTGLHLAVGGTGRVMDVTMVEGRVTGGTLVQTGGGDMVVKIGGSLNPGSGTGHAGDLNGSFVNLRGDMEIAAGSIGVIQPYIANVFELALEPRAPDPLNPAKAHSRGGIALVPGDGQVRVTTRGDMVVAGAADPGRVTQSANAGVSYMSLAEILPEPQAYWTADAAFLGVAEGELVTRASVQPLIDQGYAPTYEDFLAWYAGAFFTMETGGESTFLLARHPGDLLRTGFSLWREDTSISLFSAGGDLTPLVLDSTTNVDTNNITTADAGRYWFPGTLSVIAPSGDLFVDGGASSGGATLPVMELAPSPNGSLEFLVGGSIRGAGYVMTSTNLRLASGLAIGMSGMALNANDVPNPFRPHWESYYVRTWGGPANAGRPMLTPSPGVPSNSLLPFQRDTALGNLYEGQRDPMRFYAVRGDITNFSVGYMDWQDMTPNYIGAGPAEIRAGRDIVNFGSNALFGCGFNGLASCRTDGNIYTAGAGTIRGYVVHNDPRDISILSAGRDIIQSSMNIAGPGNLVIEAGRDIYQADLGIFRSVGPLYDLSPDTRQGGGSISILTGVGAGGPDYAGFLDLYLNPENLADPERPLAEQNIVNDESFVEDVQKVAKNYGEELAAWLETRFGYEAADGEDPRGYVATLTPQEQAIFARQVYFDELKIGGREYSGKIESGRLSSYLRSRLAIAALFPETDADGNAISYGGNLTMYGASGVRTEFGGDIEILVAGGQTTVGVGGISPPSTAGILSMGSGNIDIYSLGSILLGQSRVFTTFGGDILMWAADGDINAGRGNKSTVVYQPPRRVSDSFGNVTLSPPTQNTGAGIATLAPIPEIPAGDVDLIAPLGVIDAGEAGIRVSGDINLAALQILNAANIKVEGEATGVPVMVAVNTGALTSASSAASAVANQAADLAERARPKVRPEIPTILNVRFLGFGE